MSPKCCTSCGDWADRHIPQPIRTGYHWYRGNRLLVLTFVGVIVGVILGLSLRQANLGDGWAHMIGFPGQLLLRTLKMTVVPIIIASIISGAATLNAKTAGCMAAKTFGYFAITTISCSLIGLTLVLAIQPGSPNINQRLRGTFERQDFINSNPDEKQGTTLDSFLDLFRNAFPENIIVSCFHQVQTVYVPVKPKYLLPNATENITQTYERQQRIVGEMNALGLIVFCIAFGCALGSVGDKMNTTTMVRFFSVLDTLLIRLIRLFLWFSPVGVACLIASGLLLAEDIGTLFGQLAKFIGTVMLGLVIHQCFMLPIIYMIVLRKNPLTFAWNLSQVWLTAFSLGSSSATLPVTIRVMEEKNKVDTRVNRFVLPIGATINMNGTAIFTTVVPIFLAQIEGMSLTIPNYLTLVFMSTAISAAAAAVPSASLFLMVILTNSISVPATNLSILFAIDWLLDRCRTTSNVMGDCYAAAVIEKWAANELTEATEEYGRKHSDAEDFTHRCPLAKPEIVD